MFSHANRFSISSGRQFDAILRSFQQQEGLPFGDVLSAETIEQAFSEENCLWGQDDPDEVYTPAVTLWAFLSQAMFTHTQRSCVAAVTRVAAFWLLWANKICSSNTGAYCRARAKISEAALQRLTRETAAGCEEQVPEHWRWKGHVVRVVDGSTISLPDTPENQAVYPQAKTQKPGLGFPLFRLLTIFSLATGLLQEMTLAPYAGKGTGETTLLRQLLDRLAPGELLLADKCYCGWFLLALLKERGVDIVTLLHQLRDDNFRKGIRLGPKDHLVEWPRPAQPDWMDDETYARMPETLSLRVLEIGVNKPGFRTKQLKLVTTLCDAEIYRCEELAKLYRGRWHAELNLRNIKATMQLDVLRCKTPEMARKELWASLLAYNLIRQTMLQTAVEVNCTPLELSFSTAVQILATGWMLGLVEGYLSRLVALRILHQRAHRVGDRPDRVEPRAVKRRPDPIALLTEPRDQARAALLRRAA